MISLTVPQAKALAAIASDEGPLVVGQSESVGGLPKALHVSTYPRVYIIHLGGSVEQYDRTQIPKVVPA